MYVVVVQLPNTKQYTSLDHRDNVHSDDDCINWNAIRRPTHQQLHHPIAYRTFCWLTL